MCFDPFSLPPKKKQNVLWIIFFKKRNQFISLFGVIGLASIHLGLAWTFFFFSMHIVAKNQIQFQCTSAPKSRFSQLAKRRRRIRKEKRRRKWEIKANLIESIVPETVQEPNALFCKGAVCNLLELGGPIVSWHLRLFFFLFEWARCPVHQGQMNHRQRLLIIQTINFLFCDGKTVSSRRGEEKRRSTEIVGLENIFVIFACGGKKPENTCGNSGLGLFPHMGPCLEEECAWTPNPAGTAGTVCRFDISSFFS